MQTGVSLNSPITQSLQSRLDSYCVITDFGAIGDGVNDCTEAINRALYQIYCREVNPQVRRGIFFPAGVYKVSGTLLIPPYAYLYGEGSNSSIISFDVLPWTDGAFWSYGVLVINNGDYFRCINLNGAPIGASLPSATGGPSGTNAYWKYVPALPSYIARTANDSQQVGIDIPSGIAPTHIELNSIGFTTTQMQSGLFIEDTNCMTMRNVTVSGPLTTANLTTAVAELKAVDFASTPSLITKQIVFDTCSFSGFTWAANTEEQVRAVSFNNCEFDTLFQGVYLGGESPVNGGPTGVCVSQSSFNNIYEEGIYIKNVSLNTSTNNIFYDVANHFHGEEYPATAIITIDGENNVSVGDMFQRSTFNSTLYPRVDLRNTPNYAMINSEKIEFGTYTREVGREIWLTNDTVNQTVTTIDATLTRAVQINYTIVRVDITRTGVLSIVGSTDGTGVNLAFNDSGIENGTTGVSFDITEASSIISIKATTSDAGADALLHYSITHLA